MDEDKRIKMKGFYESLMKNNRNAGAGASVGGGIAGVAK